jgi:aromatic ring-opening dioxygenase catalytic subunit (LigB family)
MEGHRVPLVPVLLNTYYPPNRPTSSRCFNLGRALRRAIDSWPESKRVAVIGTGGLTHHVIDQEMDRTVLAAMAERDEATLTAYPESRYIDGTSEIKAWIVVAGAMQADDRPMTLVDYQPCYRSPAGTGCGNAFAYWE